MRPIMKKVGMMLVTLIIVSLCVFLSFHIIPGDPVTRMMGTEGTPAQAAALRSELGLDDPVIVQYVRWVMSFLHGDMGTSYMYEIPVADMLMDKIPITVTLSLMSFVLMIIISIPVGVFTAKHAGEIQDRTFMVINHVIMAIPPFFSGILITYVFGMIFRLFIPGGYVSYKDDFAGFIGYMIFPSIAVALPKAAMAAKLLRGSVKDEYAKDYVRTSFSRGNTANGVLYGHVLKNAMLPVINFYGMALTDMVASSIVIEQVFGIPGISRILLTSISDRDYPVVEAIIIGIAILVMLINFAVDMICRLSDPRQIRSK